MSTYPIVYQQVPAVERSRLTVFAVQIPPPQESYNRVTTLFRFILLIPVVVIQYVFILWAEVVAIAIWFVAVFTGKASTGLVDATRFPLAYMARSYAYTYLVTDIWPPFED